jgi:FKBP-type peptidyl-prolyl cis-trans isomerase
MNKFLLLIPIIILTGCLNSPEIETYDDTADLAFLEEYAQRDDVVMTDSGLMYRIIEEINPDSTRPAADNFVFVKYSGSSVDESVNFNTQGEIDIIVPSTLEIFTGLAEGVQLMTPGSIFEMVLPSELASNDGRVYVFEFELDSFLSEPSVFLQENSELEDITVTESGLQYRVIEEGEGESPEANATVRVNYTGTYANGFVFDQSGDSPAQFTLAGVISGFSEGLQLMNVGSTYELFLPPSIGYGDNPPQGSSILPGVVLVFEVELVEIVTE